MFIYTRIEIAIASSLLNFLSSSTEIPHISFTIVTDAI